MALQSGVDGAGRDRVGGHALAGVAAGDYRLLSGEVVAADDLGRGALAADGGG
jgi:hypothetical protein